MKLSPAVSAIGVGFLGWVAFTLVQLTTGQARLEERFGALESRLDRAAIHAARHPRGMSVQVVEPHRDP